MFRWADHIQHLPYLKDMVILSGLNFASVEDVVVEEKKEPKELSKGDLKKL